MSGSKCYCGQEFADEEALKNHVRAVKVAPGLYYDEEAANIAEYDDVVADDAYFRVASAHHLHDGRHCLCGFDSLGRARSATEHILDEYLKAKETP